MDSKDDRMTYSPTAKAVIDAADEFIGAIEDAWADLEGSFEIDDERQFQMDKSIEVPKDIQITYMKDAVSPLVTDVWNMQRSATEIKELNVERESMSGIDHEKCSQNPTVEPLVLFEQEQNHRPKVSLDDEHSTQSSVLAEMSVNNPKKFHHNVKVNQSLQMRIESLEEQLNLALKEKDYFEEKMNESSNQNALLEERYQKTRAEYDKREKKYQDELQMLVTKCENAHRKVQLAEDDANLALKIAKDSDDKRHRMELALESAVQELERQHNHIPTTPTIAKNIQSDDYPSSRTMNVESDSKVSSSAFSLQTLESTSENADDTSTRPNEPMKMDGPSHESQRNVGAILLTVRDIIRKSGISLNLPGKWFSDKSLPSIQTIDTDIESMSKSYCMLVENIIKQQKDDFKDLKEFCNYLEEKLIH